MEVSRVATQIRQMVATGRYRYQDFLVLARHLDAYQTVIDPFLVHSRFRTLMTPTCRWPTTLRRAVECCLTCSGGTTATPTSFGS